MVKKVTAEEKHFFSDVIQVSEINITFWTMSGEPENQFHLLALVMTATKQSSMAVKLHVSLGFPALHRMYFTKH